MTGNRRVSATPTPKGAAHKARRESLGIFKADLYYATGVDRGTQQAFEEDKRAVSPATVRKLTRALDRLEREKLAAEEQETAGQVGGLLIGTSEPSVEYTVELPDGTTVRTSVRGEVDFGELVARMAELVARIQAVKGEPPSDGQL